MLSKTCLNQTLSKLEISLFFLKFNLHKQNNGKLLSDPHQSKQNCTKPTLIRQSSNYTMQKKDKNGTRQPLNKFLTWNRCIEIQWIRNTCFKLRSRTLS